MHESAEYITKGMVHMKRKNAGLSTVEIIVAAVIVVVIVVGILVAVKMSGKEPTEDLNETKAKEIAESLAAKVEDCTKNADLDIIIDGQGYSRFVGSNKYQVFYMDNTAKKVYFVEKDTSDLGSDPKEIREKAKSITFQPDEMELLASDVITFLPELSNPASLEGALKIVTNVKVGDASKPAEKTIPLNKSAIEYFAEKANVDITVPTESPTPTPVQTNTPTPTPKPDDPTPEPTKPADTPTPQPKEMKSREVSSGTNNSRTVILNQHVSLMSKDAVLRVVVKRNENETTNMKGAEIGGICFNEVNVPDMSYLYILDHDPEIGEEFSLTSYPLAKLYEDAKASGSTKVMVRINDGSGYDLVGIYIDYWE